jgi:hypothetical protein
MSLPVEVATTRQFYIVRNRVRRGRCFTVFFVAIWLDCQP